MVIDTWNWHALELSTTAFHFTLLVGMKTDEQLTPCNQSYIFRAIPDLCLEERLLYDSVRGNYVDLGIRLLALNDFK